VLGVVGEGPVGVGQVEGVGVGDGHADPELRKGLEGLVVEAGLRRSVSVSGW
jgi:hypothetical protein